MEIIANSAQSVASGSNVQFTDVIIPGNCTIMHREDSGLITLRGLVSGQSRARFRVFFNGNIAIPSGGTAQSISTAIAINGEEIGCTTMYATPTDNNYWNVSAMTYIDVPIGCCTTVSVKNTSSIAINVQNANFIAERVA